MNAPENFENVLNEFRGFLHQMENALPDRDAAELDRLCRTFTQFHCDMHHALKEIPESYKGAQQLYRQTVNTILAEADIIRRCIEMPRGYHGDFETMEMMYRNGFEGTTPRGKLLHKMIVSGRECASVRARKDFLTQRIDGLLTDSRKRLSFCSIAAGPATEWRSIPCDLHSNVERIVLLDQDEVALAYAFAQLPSALQAVTELVNVSVADLLFNRAQTSVKSNFDYIYSAGLFDYLDGPTARALVRRSVKMLRPKGSLEVGNFSVWPAAVFADLSSGWRLILRTETEMHGLLQSGLGGLTHKVADQTFLCVSA